MKNKEEKKYLDILQNILDNWVEENDRTWVWTLSTFWEKMVFDLSTWKYPLLTTKRTFFRWIVTELIWLIRWDTNIQYLLKRNNHIWTEWPFANYLQVNNLEKKFPRYTKEWKEKMKEFENNIIKNNDFAKKWGELWPVYGSQWRNFNWEQVDQIRNVIHSIKNNPTSRRQLVIAYNPAQIEDMLLPPCHMMFQFNVNTKKGTLDCQMYQRSADWFLGVPFNIGSYSLLLILIAKITWLKPWKFIHITWNSHVYLNHKNQCKEQLTRCSFNFPEIDILKDVKTLEDLEDLEFSDFELKDYKCHKWIKAPIAV